MFILPECCLNQEFRFDQITYANAQLEHGFIAWRVL